MTSDGTIYTGQFFGTNEISAPENGRVTFAATGQNRRCAMTEHNGTHKVYCGSDSQAPDTQVTGLPDERMISMDVGYGDGCVLTESRTAYCWTTSGGYVTPKNVAAYTAVEIPLPKDNAAFISVSEYRACVAYEDDDASCFAESQDYSIGWVRFRALKSSILRAVKTIHAFWMIKVKHTVRVLVRIFLR